jgi:excisionase family DNA binding protein
MTTAQKTWLTRQEAAERAGISLRTVDRMLADGTLTGRRVRGRYRVKIDQTELDLAMEGSAA